MGMALKDASKPYKALPDAPSDRSDFDLLVFRPLMHVHTMPQSKTVHLGLCTSFPSAVLGQAETKSALSLNKKCVRLSTVPLQKGQLVFVGFGFECVHDWEI